MYLSAYDEFLAKCVRDHESHKVAYGRKIEAFEAVRASFIKENLSRVCPIHEMPSTKSVRGCYHRFVEKRRGAVRDNERLSGNAETVTDLDVLLDNLILEKKNFEERTRAERKEQHV